MIFFYYTPVDWETRERNEKENLQFNADQDSPTGIGARWLCSQIGSQNVCASAALKNFMLDLFCTFYSDCKLCFSHIASHVRDMFFNHRFIVKIPRQFKETKSKRT